MVKRWSRIVIAFGCVAIFYSVYRDVVGQTFTEQRSYNNFSESFYFPGGLYSDFQTKWYSKHLFAMKEPSLWKASKESDLESYRFLWLRSFHQPVVVRLTIGKEGTGLLVAKITNGAGGYRPGVMIKNQEISISREEVSKFLKELNEMKFWNLSFKDEKIGMDGARWVIEGIKDKKYHVVDRWSPKSGDVRDAALMLVHIAKLDVQPVY